VAQLKRRVVVNSHGNFPTQHRNNSVRRHHQTNGRYNNYNNISPSLAATAGGSGDNDDLNSKTAGFPFPLPSLSQILSVWIIGVSAKRIAQSDILSGGEMGMNLAVNAALFVGAGFVLVKSIRGIDYDSLEDLEQKSLAKQAGAWALEGCVPTRLEVADDDGGTSATYEVATFAGGCFWGTELTFQRIPGVIATCVGYTQGAIQRPNYEQVCSGTTGHTEAIQLIYDPNECSYERLLNALFNTINPTLVNRVNNDMGTQYRHGVYPHTNEQQIAADSFFETLRNKYETRGEGPIVTELKDAAVFWPAENYHQRYLEKRGQSAEKDCEEKVRCYG